MGVRICLDLDGVICEIRPEGVPYSDLKPLPGACEAIRQLRSEGHIVIIHTARHMKTCSGNAGQVLARIGGTTLRWHERHNIEFDEIYFGKPWADIYVDDNGFRFDSWKGLDLNHLSSERPEHGSGSLST